MHPDPPTRTQAVVPCDKEPGPMAERPTEPPITPRLTPIPVDGTTLCGRITDGDRTPCNRPAAWHVQWRPGHGSFACGQHMAEARRLFAYIDRHRVCPDC